MKFFQQIVLGLVLVLAIMGSLASAKPQEAGEPEESLVEDSESGGSVPEDAQQDYLNVADFTTAAPTWWWN
ncbi:uncharacterized protein LOC108023325 [Drosophila biarmipes]|uniref:uncharacterized protein LOC108023325 n=1 Tax=Drosophila biarmipes TaxID=125945 RepID=UPI0007E63C85|nr:uncharacterized protein LOC108023325 [Drosophila biarmipes]